ncbi:hypothetical protein BDV25DRAFT_171350 [Aspergillus avenaceus]|uniref:F-box domain-containing protein n=1 Tax=Aspergillus avenaceus TaxID=36643 RepID=A0A5N6TYX8_ASPAV|nr:hypothetical protein BDV25DRAFT_171350 [Aspergillus avenaceus]
MGSWTREKHTTGRCHLLELPAELLIGIASYLAVVPRACLAMTCKRLFAVEAVSLKSQSLCFDQDFAPVFQHYRNNHTFRSDRWQLIISLEDQRWLACSRCLKLHPQSSFSMRERNRPPNDRLCNLGPLAGIVGLCPCMKMTFRDKIDLVELLQVRERAMTALATQCGPIMRDFCWHSCVTNYASTEMKVELYPELDSNNMLNIRTNYQLRVVKGRLGTKEYITPRLGCPHRSLDLWLTSVCQTDLCPRCGTPCTMASRISACDRCKTSMQCTLKQPTTGGEQDGRVVYLFSTERCIGRGDISMPDQGWAIQRSHPADSSVYRDGCGEFCPWVLHGH